MIYKAPATFCFGRIIPCFCGSENFLVHHWGRLRPWGFDVFAMCWSFLKEGFLPMLEEYEVSTEDARALCAKVVEAVDMPCRPVGFWFRSKLWNRGDHPFNPKIDGHYGHSDALKSLNTKDWHQMHPNAILEDQSSAHKWHLDMLQIRLLHRSELQMRSRQSRAPWMKSFYVMYRSLDSVSWDGIWYDMMIWWDVGQMLAKWVLTLIQGGLADEENGV